MIPKIAQSEGKICLATWKLFLNFFFSTRTPRISLMFAEKSFKKLFFSVCSVRSVYKRTRLQT